MRLFILKTVSEHCSWRYGYKIYTEHCHIGLNQCNSLLCVPVKSCQDVNECNLYTTMTEKTYKCQTDKTAAIASKHTKHKYISIAETFKVWLLTSYWWEAETLEGAQVRAEGRCCHTQKQSWNTTAGNNNYLYYSPQLAAQVHLGVSPLLSSFNPSERTMDLQYLWTCCNAEDWGRPACLFR